MAIVPIDINNDPGNQMKKREWTRIANSLILPLIVREALLFFEI
jgi:hypothetical protein